MAVDVTPNALCTVKVHITPIKLSSTAGTQQAITDVLGHFKSSWNAFSEGCGRGWCSRIDDGGVLAREKSHRTSSQ